MFQNIVPMLARSSKVAFSFATKNSNALLATTGLLSLMGLTGSLISAVPKVKEEVQKAKDDLEIAKDEETERKIKAGAAKRVALILIVPILLFFVCSGSIIGNAYLNDKKLAALATAYALSEQKIEDLEAAAKEIVGGKKAVERRASRNEEDVIETGHGNDLFWEPKTGHWLRANNDFVILAFKNVQQVLDGTEMISGDKQTLNDLFEYLKLPSNTEIGQWFGWHPGDNVGCNLLNTGKHYWDNGKDEYYKVIDYYIIFMGKEGHHV